MVPGRYLVRPDWVRFGGPLRGHGQRRALPRHAHRLPAGDRRWAPCSLREPGPPRFAAAGDATSCAIERVWRMPAMLDERAGRLSCGAMTMTREPTGDLRRRAGLPAGHPPVARRPALERGRPGSSHACLTAGHQRDAAPALARPSWSTIGESRNVCAEPQGQPRVGCHLPPPCAGRVAALLGARASPGRRPIPRPCACRRTSRRASRPRSMSCWAIPRSAPTAIPSTRPRPCDDPTACS